MVSPQRGLADAHGGCKHYAAYTQANIYNDFVKASAEQDEMTSLPLVHGRRSLFHALPVINMQQSILVTASLASEIASLSLIIASK